MVLNGIDVSGFQPSNIGSLVSADFGLVKVTEGTTYTSGSAVAQAATFGRKGFYHFASGLSSGASEAAYFVNALTARGFVGTGLLVLDWEASAISQGVGYAKAFLDAVANSTGVTPVIYMSSAVVSAYDWSSVAGTYPLWVASYGSNPVRTSYASLSAPTVPHWGTPLLYQYGSLGRLSGYSGNLDLDIFFGTKSAWDTLAGVAVEPTPTPVGDIMSSFLVRVDDGKGKKTYNTFLANYDNIQCAHVTSSAQEKFIHSQGVPYFPASKAIQAKTVLAGLVQVKGDGANV